MIIFENEKSVEHISMKLRGFEAFRLADLCTASYRNVKPKDSHTPRFKILKLILHVCRGENLHIGWSQNRDLHSQSYLVEMKLWVQCKFLAHRNRVVTITKFRKFHFSKKYFRQNDDFRECR